MPITGDRFGFSAEFWIILHFVHFGTVCRTELYTRNVHTVQDQELAHWDPYAVNQLSSQYQLFIPLPKIDCLGYVAKTVIFPCFFFILAFYFVNILLGKV